MKAETSFSLKDQLFNPQKVAYLADLITKAHPTFPSATFQTDVVTPFPDLALKERLAHITACLHQHLPQDYRTALDILLRALPPELDPTKSDDDFGDFIFAPLALFVALHGRTPADLMVSLQALKEMTKRFSAEDAIRFFLNSFPDKSFAFLSLCTADSNYHVRRWVSEGTRPKLPWAHKLETDFKRPLPFLDQLYSDPTRYVTRSVANHLNDISKIDPDLVVATLQRWQAGGRQTEKEMGFITRHSLRTLTKQGHSGALTLLGFGEAPNITITDFTTSTPQVKVGDALHFQFTLTAHQSQNLMIDYLMEFASDGKRAGKKVFKLKQLEMQADGSKQIKKKHPLRLMTTRRLVLGQHKITLQVNGQPFDSLTFDLVAG